MASRNDVEVTKAVAAVAADGFLSFAAPVKKARGKPAVILLSADLKVALEHMRLVESKDIYHAPYGTRVEHGLIWFVPQGWRNSDKTEAERWYNHASQWFDAALFLAFVDQKIAKTENTPVGWWLARSLFEQAAKLNPQAVKHE